MLLIIREKATKGEIKDMAQDQGGFYIKIVADIEREILTGGGERHFDGEQKLLEDSSVQENLWGGGIDIKSREIDYNSMINLRSRQGNDSRDILSIDIRKKFDNIVRKLLL